MGLIYKATNLINSKIYIGQTKYDTVDNRRRYHESSYGYALSEAIKEFGRENFKWEILKTVEDPEELSYWEKAFIITLNSAHPEIGYNKIGYNGHREEILQKIDIYNIVEDKLEVIKENINNNNIEKSNNTNIEPILNELIQSINLINHNIKNFDILYQETINQTIKSNEATYEKIKKEVNKIRETYNNYYHNSFYTALLYLYRTIRYKIITTQANIKRNTKNVYNWIKNQFIQTKNTATEGNNNIIENTDNNIENNSKIDSIDTIISQDNSSSIQDINNILNKVKDNIKKHNSELDEINLGNIFNDDNLANININNNKLNIDTIDIEKLKQKLDMIWSLMFDIKTDVDVLPKQLEIKTNQLQDKINNQINKLGLLIVKNSKSSKSHYLKTTIITVIIVIIFLFFFI